MSGSRGPTAAVLLVRDVLAPSDRAAGLVVLLHGDVDHETVRGGAVPVVLTGLEEDAVAGTDLLRRAALALAHADALGDEDRLAVRMRMPCGARAGREMHARGGEGGGSLRRRDGVDVDVAGKPVGGALLGLDAAAGDLHFAVPLLDWVSKRPRARACRRGPRGRVWLGARQREAWPGRAAGGATASRAAPVREGRWRRSARPRRDGPAAPA